MIVSRAGLFEAAFVGLNGNSTLTDSAFAGLSFAGSSFAGSSSAVSLSSGSSFVGSSFVDVFQDYSFYSCYHYNFYD